MPVSTSGISGTSALFLTFAFAFWLPVQAGADVGTVSYDAGQSAAVVVDAGVVTVPDAGSAEVVKEADVTPAGLSIPLGPDWKPLTFYSGDINYYSVMEQDGKRFIHAAYKPGLDTVILHRKVKKSTNYNWLYWKWRVVTHPTNSNETIDGRRDSAAAVYIYFSSGIKKYVLKYIWSASLEKGFNFENPDNSIFQKMHVIMLEGAPAVTGEWRAEKIDLKSEFRKYFKNGDKNAEVLPVVGIGLLTDGDGTNSISEADYADFVLGE